MSDKSGPWGHKPKEMEENNDGLTIFCPSCGEDNEINPGSSLVCQKCKKPLGGKDPYFRIGLAPIAVLLALASGGTWAVTEFVAVERYPILVEHAVMEDCINQSRSPLSRSHLLRKREICACALERTEKDLSEEDFEFAATHKRRFWNAKYVKIFEKHAEDCL